MSKKKKKVRPEPESLGLEPVGVETHAHLDMEEFEEDLDEVLARARRSGVAHIGQVFLGPAAYARNRARFQGRDGFFFIMGVHPHNATSVDQGVLDAMREAFVADPALKAVGETGLDYFYDYSPHEVQRRAFRDQLRLARDLDKPVVIHSRDAEDETIAILEEEGFSGRPLLWHCFGRDKDFAARVVEHGWLMSIPGTVTFKKSDMLREAVAQIPMDRLVVETDCPYMAPDPYRGKRNEPAFCVFTAREIARVKDMDVQEVWRHAAQNAKGFFGLE